MPYKECLRKEFFLARARTAYGQLCSTRNTFEKSFFLSSGTDSLRSTLLYKECFREKFFLGSGTDSLRSVLLYKESLTYGKLCSTKTSEKRCFSFQTHVTRGHFPFTKTSSVHDLVQTQEKGIGPQVNITKLIFVQKTAWI